MRKSYAAAAVFLSASLIGAGLTLADNPPSATPGASGKPADVQNETPQIQKLREARKHLNEAKDAFDSVPKDSADHRKEVLEGIDKALNSIDAEIEELKTGK